MIELSAGLTFLWILALAILLWPLMKSGVRLNQPWVLGILVVLPVMSIGVYAWKGSVTIQEQTQMPEIKDDLVSRLEAKLRQNPEDIEGWIMLARSYEVLGEKEKSLKAYQKVRIQIKAMIDGLPDNHQDIDDLKMLLKQLPKS